MSYEENIIVFTCQKCGIEIEADDTYAGSIVECPGCNNTVMIPAPGIEPGMVIDDFIIDRRLGVSEEGELWLATQEQMNREVVLKILPPALTEDTTLFSRFRKEVKTVGAIDHPNIAKAIKAGSDKGIHYLATVYVKGEPLDKKIKYEKIISEQEALTYARCIAEALAYAWNELQLVHRDIKPSNIIITPKGRAKLTDIGLSKSMSEDVSITKTGIILGTPSFMSPESAKAADNLDCRSDIYSLGATLYYMTTGKIPFDDVNSSKVFMRQLREPFPSPKKDNPKLSANLDKLVKIMTAKQRKSRQQNWEQVLKDINAVLKGKAPLSKIPKAAKGAQSMLNPDEELKKRKPAKSAKKAKVHKENPVKSPLAKPSVIFLAILIIGGVIGGLIYGKIQLDKKKAAQQKAKKETEANKRSAGKEELEAKDQKRKEEIEKIKRWKTAVAYANNFEKKEDFYGKALEEFEKIKKDYPEEYGEKASKAMIILKRAKEKSVAKVIEDLKKKAESYEKRKAYTSAVKLYNDYAGLWVKETEAERKKEQAHYQELADKYAEERKKASELANKNRYKLAEILSIDIAKGNYKSALADYNKSMLKKDYPQAEKIIKSLLDAKSIISKQFDKEINKKIILPIKGKKKKLTIKEVSKGKLSLEEKMGAIKVNLKYSITDLPVDEIAKRFVAADKVPGHIFAGVLFLKKKQYKEAINHFKHTSYFARPLIKIAQERRKNKN